MPGALRMCPQGSGFSGRRGEQEDVLAAVRGALRPRDLEVACGPPLIPIGGRPFGVHPGDSRCATCEGLGV